MKKPSKKQKEQDQEIAEKHEESLDKNEMIEASEPTLQDLPGIGAATAEKLGEAGYGTLLSVAVASPGELIEVAGMTETTARKVIQGARGMLDMGFESGEQLLARRKRVQKISVGSKAFDELLGGGFETGAITECFGQYGSSKTQIAHQLAVNVIKHFQDLGEEAYAVFIDTENTFRPERIEDFANGSGMDPEQVLKHIKVARAYNSDHQVLMAEKVDELVTKQKLNVKLVIVDSLTAHFRAEFIGRGTLAERQQKLNKHMHTLSRLADVHNCTVYVTNQVMSKPDQFFGDPTEAIGGHIVAHNSTFRIYLRRGKKGSRVAKLIDSPNLPDSECVFYITQTGIRDEP